MEFPIKAAQLKLEEQLNDQEATMLVLEAISRDEIDENIFSDPSDAKSAIVRVKTWEHFEQYLSQINIQKKLFNPELSINSSSDVTNPTDSEIESLVSIAVKNKTNSSQNFYKKLSIAASFMLFALLSSTLTLAIFDENNLQNYSSSVSESTKTNEQSSNRSVAPKNSARKNQNDVGASVDSSGDSVFEGSKSESFSGSLEPLKLYNSRSSSNVSARVYDLGNTNSENIFKSKIILFKYFENSYQLDSSSETLDLILSEVGSSCLVPKSFDSDTLFISKVGTNTLIGGYRVNDEGIDAPYILDC